MTDGTGPADPGAGWFAGLDATDVDAAGESITTGGADDPREWPQLAVESEATDSIEEYYDHLREATIRATRDEVREREAADDQQVIHAIRAMDDCRRTANELAERLAEWGGSVDPDAGTGVEYARTLAAPSSAASGAALAAGGSDRRLRSLANRIVSLDDEADALRSFVERRTPEVAPNLSALAGPILAARLVSLAGGLETLAKKPSGTVQVLGAEEALFAHLRGHAPSPKHGVIFTHEAVRGTRPADRGSAARALAGKLAIAARVDHYSGDLRPELEADLEERLATIRARADGDGGGDESANAGGAETDADRSGGDSDV